MRWLLVLAVAASLYVSDTAAADEVIYLRGQDPWTQVSDLRYTPKHDRVLPEKGVDYDRQIVVVGELQHVYYAHWPKGCTALACAKIRHKVEVRDGMTFACDRTEFTDELSRSHDCGRSLRYWQRERARLGLGPPAPRVTAAERHGLLKSSPAPIASPPARLAQTTR